MPPIDINRAVNNSIEQSKAFRDLNRRVDQQDAEVAQLKKLLAVQGAELARLRERVRTMPEIPDVQ